VGLLATTLGRLYVSTYYALNDTRTPLRFAVLRVTLTTVLGYVCALRLPGWIGIDAHWGAAGLTASAGVAGWIEFLLLRSRLNRRIGRTGLPLPLTAELWGAAVFAALSALAMKELTLGAPRFLGGVAVLVTFGVVYLASTVLLRIPEAEELVRRGR
jgi:putative peptidoglycan lipid II flippase